MAVKKKEMRKTNEINPCCRLAAPTEKPEYHVIDRVLIFSLQSRPLTKTNKRLYPNKRMARQMKVRDLIKFSLCPRVVEDQSLPVGYIRNAYYNGVGR